MTDLNEQFETASKDVQTLTKKPGNDILLKLYSLFKQGSVGDVTGKRPGMTDFKGRAKYDAWSKCQGTPQDKAKQEYIDLVASLKG
ncbi:Acyl-CoA-binding protein homolog [Desulfamplus magnetovallimortis]|uniref:Acyl-CoA-binding protein homolog n=1 Tax=Desulfamplus magnetovallimortis TaxID=1246637 RepID=A0A1W1HIV6_9BACT|nr:acyl-CoA-binding protein [Desulfamplus magnetovallimortis]SLM32373.1 Acyl-CoA-binding protein homolog [Desulfamplus magnetovallimortis]